MPRFSFASLRVRLFLLVLFAVIPALAVILYTASEQRRSSTAQVVENVVRLADLESKSYDEIVIAARDLLVALTQFNEVRSGGVSRCRAFLVDMQKQFEKYLVMGVANPDGEIICASRPRATSVNVTDRSWFRRARATRGFAAGDHEIDDFTSQPSISFAQPILNPNGTVRAIIFAAMNLKWLQDATIQMELPAQATLHVIDRNGTPLVRYPEPGRPGAKSIPEDLFFNTIVTSPTFSTRIDIRFFYGSECEKVSSFQGVTVSKWL